MMLESANLPLRLERYDGPGEAARWLAGKPGAVLVLPLAENDTLAMLDGLAHGRPLVNGDSGFVPRAFDRAMELFEHGLDDEDLRFLRAVDVRHAWFPASGASPPAGVRKRLASRARPSRDRRRPRRERRRGGARPCPPVRVEGILLGLLEPRSIGRIAFELSDDPWIARPRVEPRSTASAGRRSTPRPASPTRRCRYTGTRAARAARSASGGPCAPLRVDARLPARAGLLEVGE
jgi:hypothetical protein